MIRTADRVKELVTFRRLASDHFVDILSTILRTWLSVETGGVNDPSKDRFDFFQVPFGKEFAENGFLRMG
jgi:hypothetical protein